MTHFSSGDALDDAVVAVVASSVGMDGKEDDPAEQRGRSSFNDEVAVAVEGWPGRW